jgi:DNA helicase-2/ATP-dependent DNA helicase PcrA
VDLLRGCDAAQVEAITTRAAPLCILAGAGSGKTRVLTRRIAWRVAQGDAAPAHVLALTFTRKAAGELRGRLAALDVAEGTVAGTFHAVALAQLRQLAADQGRRPPVVLDSKGRLLSGIVRRGIGEVAGEIDWAKARLVRPRDYEAAGRSPSAGAHQVAIYYERYEAERRRQGLLDFEDLLTTLTRVIETDPDVAAAQRWRFRHLFVDEYQDVNPAQQRLLQAWLGGRSDLCVVGDPDQAIYSWNGADPQILHRFEGEVLTLDTNYRSTPQVVAVAASALGGATRASRADGAVPTIEDYGTDADEAAAVAAALRRAHGPGRRWSDMAVLARTNAQLALFEQACSAIAVPFRSGAGRAFLQHSTVRAFLARANQASGDAFRRLVVDFDDAPSHDDAQVNEDVATLQRLARDYLSLDPGGNGAGFAAWARMSVRAEPMGSAGDAVDLLTFHGAKGLEWRVVFVTGLERGLVPMAEGDFDEERRLLYVALTRAEDELHCSWARRRVFGASTARRDPSPWLAAIEAARRSIARLPGRQVRSGAIAAGRAALASTHVEPAAPADAHADPLVVALRGWRDGTARAAKVPAHVVIPEQALDALAEARPRSRAELAELIGPSRAATYGDRLLDLVRRHDPAGA